jgi:hypothetical protein
MQKPLIWMKKTLKRKVVDRIQKIEGLIEK